ncbi:TonB-dependent receptor [Aliarcobacter butzleri]|uniref:TonB-dependent receptor domain-containing protein n=1 Tax=Aliarcobacter butzleri TaxID=28197 RepID=UPI0021B39401|nr:TonB-dependent receptor [Aliarcobacter butzleri]MCT7549944.1 TonB-dependent receptor [Aliarcobacter butzleri]MCT7559508.1 TonB-dependent receptor [Aliarcobacter butzleri]UXC30060.1 TonB-dependent receptor [Aliarcobacter butzleri]
MIKIKMARSVATLLAVCSGTLLSANETTTLDEVQVVTTAGGYEQNIADAAATISVITKEELENKSYSDVTDVLKNVPGVYVNGGGSNQSISIRGMGASYTLYLIDGKPMQDNQAFSPNGSGGGNQINFLPPLEAIERIEVVRGPASSLYGSDAMGGVINIITKKHSDKPTASIKTEYIKADSSNKVNNDSQNTTIYASTPLIDKLLSLQITGGYLTTDESNFTSSGSLKAGSDPDFERKNIGTKLILTPDENNTITAGYSYTLQERTSNPGKSIPQYTTGSGTSNNGFSMDGNGYVYDNSGKQVGWDGTSTTRNGNTTYSYTTDNEKSHQKYDKYNYNLTHEAKYNKILVNSYLQYDNDKNHTRTNSTTGNGIEMDTITANSQGTYFFDTNSLTIGANYKKENLEDGATSSLNNDIIKMERYQWAIFAEDTWNVVDDLALTLSGRYDDNEIFGSNFSPKAYAVYSLTDNLNLKGGVTTGYKAPSLRESAPDFAGVSRGGIMIGNLDLTPETSINYEMGLTYDNPDIGLEGSVVAFQTDFDDKISRTSRVCQPNQPCTYKGTTYAPHQYGYTAYENIDKAEIKGVELTTDYYILDNLKYRHSYTYTDSEQKSGDRKGKQLNDISKHMFNAGLNWNVTSKLLLWTQGNYRGKTAGNSSDIQTPSYTFIDLGTVYKYDKDLSFTAGVYNITNKDVTDDDNTNVLDGRRYSVAMNLKF